MKRSTSTKRCCISTGKHVYMKQQDLKGFCRWLSPGHGAEHATLAAPGSAATLSFLPTGICDAPPPPTPSSCGLRASKLAPVFTAQPVMPPPPTRSSLYRFSKHLPAAVTCQASCALTLESQNPILHPQGPLDPPEERLYRQGIIGIQCDNCVCVVSRAGGGGCAGGSRGGAGQGGFTALVTLWP